MQSKLAVLVGILCLFTANAFGSISSISPTQFSLGTEDFLTIRGTDLAGSVETWVVYDGERMVEPQSASSTEIQVWVPVLVLLEAGTHTVEVRSVDATAVRTHGPVTFTVAAAPASGPPLLGLPESVSAEAEDGSGAHVEFTAVAVSADGTPVDVTCSPASGSLFALGFTRVDCSATDAGGTSTGSFLVYVTDTVPPVVTVPDDIVSAEAVVTFSASAVDAIDGAVPVTCSPASGSTFAAGITHVVCTATDAHANRGVGTFDVTVTNGAPVLTLPDDINVEAQGPGGAVVNFTATAILADTVTCTPPSGSTFPLGTTTVSCAATNSFGTTTGTFLINVYDTTPPVLSIPAGITAEATSADGAVVSWTATATDLVDGVRPVTCVPASGSLFALGTTTVVCMASDTSGHDAIGSFDVVVQDTTPPAIVNVTVNPGTLWPPNHRMIAVTVQAMAVDLVDPSPSAVRIVSVSSNQPINGTGDGDSGPDWEITGPLTLNLRAERAGNGAERVYTITLESHDGSGNSGTTTVNVYVRDSSSSTTTRRRATH